jgi:NADH-quinone oxidoreductase subunit A
MLNFTLLMETSRSNTEYLLTNFKFSTLLEEEFFGIFCFFIVAAVLAGIIVTLSYVLSVQNPETEKLSTYECGFEPYEDTRNQFDVRFYLIAILFIVFDIEAVYLYPWCVSISQLSITGFWSMVDFVLELGVGFVYVWIVGALNWD